MGLKEIAAAVAGLTIAVVYALHTVSPFTKLILYVVVSVSLITAIIEVLVASDEEKWTNLSWLWAGFISPMFLSMSILLDFMFKNVTASNVGIWALALFVLSPIMMVFWLFLRYLTELVFFRC